MLTHIVIGVVVLAAAVAGGIFAYCRSEGMLRKVYALGLLSQYAPGEAGCHWLTPRFKGTLSGLKFTVSLPRTNSASGVGLELCVYTVPLFQLQMHRGMDVDGVTGSRGQMDFDIGDDPYSKASPYLDDIQRRQYIWNFLTTGFTSFLVEKDRVRIMMPSCDIVEDLKAPTLYIQLLALVQLAKDSAK